MVRPTILKETLSGRTRSQKLMGGWGQVTGLGAYLPSKSRGLVLKEFMSLRLDMISASVFPALNVTSHMSAQDLMAVRSELRETASCSRCVGEGSEIEPQRVESSAKTSRELLTTSKRSLINTRNKRGARTLPCGTPALISRYGEP